MQKIKHSLFTSPLLSAAAIFFIIAAVLALVTPTPQRPAVKSIVKQPTPTVTVTPAPSQSVIETQQILTPTATPTITSAPTTVSQSTTASTATPQPTIQTVQTFQVSLSINGSSVGSVTVEQGANHCDVLSKAKEQGKISQLLMKYDNSLGTNGVYQINGIGKENTIWWVYKVNGQSPGQGCSYLKANSGENVEWEYKGS